MKVTTSTLIVCVFLFLVGNNVALAQTVEYDLYIAKQPVNFTGTPVEAMTVNGSIPGPTVELTEGDFAKIQVHNQMDVETSVHWHGILLPNREDGVPYLTTAPIMPNSTHLFQFPLIQSGTYWYHSHTGLQEQRGVYGSIVIHPKKETIKADHDYVIVLSDWTDENPDEVLRTLKRGSEYYSLKKGSMQSIWGAFKAKSLTDVFHRSLQMMPPMDLSDVGYDVFLTNGKKVEKLEAQPGEKVRLRIINAAASTYFYLQFAGGPMQIISADGLDVKPVMTERFLMTVAETYDVLLTMPNDQKSLEFRATAQDGSGFTSAYLGEGEKVAAPDVQKPQIYKMMHSDMDMSHGMDSMADGHGSEMETKHDMGSMKDESMPEVSPTPQHQKMTSMEKMSMSLHDTSKSERPLAPYKILSSPASTALNQSNTLREFKLTLTGDMERYVWSFDSKVLTEADKLLIKKGENVRITFINTTMMHHPLHLHGHFFRVVNGKDNEAPLKHTVDIPPMATQVIEFYANEEKDWFLHCHILYHMKTGMSRVVSYQGSTIDPDILEARKLPNFLNHDSWYAWGEADLLTNMTEGELVAANTRSSLTLNWEKDWPENEFEVDTAYGYYFNRFCTAFAGLTITEDHLRGISGFKTITPLLFDVEARIDSEGEGRVTIEKELQLTDRVSLYGESQYDTESKWEWKGGLEVGISKSVSALVQYHSEYDAGIGIHIRF